MNKMEKFIEVLKSCGYDANFVKTKEEAFELAKTYIKSGNTSTKYQLSFSSLC